MTDRRLDAFRSGSPWLVLGVVVAATLVALVILGGFYIAAMSDRDRVKVTDVDRGALVTAGDLESVIGSFVLSRSSESFTKYRRRDESVELYYEYEHPNLADSFRLLCTIVVKPNRNDARDAFKTLDELARAGWGPDVSFKPHNDIFSAGDAAEFGTLSINEQTRGVYLISRRGERVFLFEFQGQRRVGPEQFVEILRAAVDNLESYMR